MNSINVITSRLFVNISGKFRKISGNIKFPKKLQPVPFGVPQRQRLRAVVVRALHDEIVPRCRSASTTAAHVR